MTDSIDLKKAERKVFVSYFQDGLWDIGLGGFFSMFAIAPLLSETMGDFWSSAVFVPFWGLLYGVLWTARQRVVRPRIGEVKFGPQRKSRMIRFNLIMLVTLSMALILGFLSFVQLETIPGWVHAARFSFIMLVGFSIAAYYLNFSRLYMYGFLAAVAPLVGEWLWVNLGVSHHGYPITYGFVSGLMILIGMVQLITLIRVYSPLPAPSDPEEIDG